MIFLLCMAKASTFAPALQERQSVFLKCW